METTRSGSSAPPAAGETITVSYVPQPGLLWVAVSNAILNVITLTIYRFWGRTRVRRHVWSCVHINGEPLEYTGTGTKLFLGALIVFGVLGLPIALVYLVITLRFGPGHPALAGLNFMVFLLVALLWGMAVYRARRYRLSRTLWRGIRSTLAGSSMSYSLLYFGAQILRFVTLGWSTPAMDINLQERVFGDMRFGTMPFRFSGPAGPLYPRYAISWFIAIAVFVVAIVLIGAAIVTFFGTAITDFLRIFDQTSPQPPTQETIWKLIAIVYAGVAVLIAAWLIQSLVWAFYSAREMNVFAAYTTIDQARFKRGRSSPRKASR